MLFKIVQSLLTLTIVLAAPAQDALIPGRYRITNVHFRGDARILPVDASDIVRAGPYGNSLPNQDLWDVHPVPGGFTIKNAGLGKFATSISDAEGSVISLFGGKNPETFSITRAGLGEYTISVLSQDLLWAATDLECIKCNPELDGYVTLQHADGTAAERWVFKKN